MSENDNDNYSTTKPLLESTNSYKNNNNNNNKSSRKRHYGTINDNDTNQLLLPSSSSSSVSSSSIINLINNNNNNNNNNQRTTLSFIQKFGFGLGHIFNDLCATLWFSYTLLFLKSILLISSTKAGILIMIGQISDALATPIIGILTDRYGTKRQWHIYGTIFVFLSFPMIFTLCPWCNILPEWWTFIYFTIFIIIFQLSWACVQITHLSIIPELSVTEIDRSDLTATRYSASVFSNIIVFVITWFILKGHDNNNGNNNNNIGPIDGYRFRDISLILTLIGLTMTVLFHFSLALSGYEKRRLYFINNKNINQTQSSSTTTTSSQPQLIAATTSSSSSLTGASTSSVSGLVNKKILNENNKYKKLTLNDDNDDDDNNINSIIDNNNINENYNYKNIFKTKIIYQYSLLYVFARLFMTTSLIYMPLWLDQQTYIPNNNNINNNNTINIEYLAIIPLISFLSSFITSIIIKNFNLFINHKFNYLIGSLIGLICCIWIIFINKITIIKLYLIAILIGSGSSITMITSLCIIADMIGKNTYQGGVIYSTVTFADKFITGIIIVIIETMKCEKRFDCPQYYQNVLSYGCGLASIFGILILLSLQCNKKQENINNSTNINV